jgi:hypothetical protein
MEGNLLEPRLQRPLLQKLQAELQRQQPRKTEETK